MRLASEPALSSGKTAFCRPNLNLNLRGELDSLMGRSGETRLGLCSDSSLGWLWVLLGLAGGFGWVPCTSCIDTARVLSNLGRAVQELARTSKHHNAKASRCTPPFCWSITTDCWEVPFVSVCCPNKTAERRHCGIQQTQQKAASFSILADCHRAHDSISTFCHASWRPEV